jgi:hypothetical protein
MADAATLTAEDRGFKSRLILDEPELNAAIAWAQNLHALLRRKMTGDLEQRVAAADGAMLARFAVRDCRGFEAINAALKLLRTTSPVEGRISRPKMLKQTMDGRAGFRLLRAPGLHAVRSLIGTQGAGEPNFVCRLGRQALGARCKAAPPSRTQRGQAVSAARMLAPGVEWKRPPTAFARPRGFGNVTTGQREARGACHWQRGLRLRA